MLSRRCCSEHRERERRWSLPPSSVRAAHIRELERAGEISAHTYTRTHSLSQNTHTHALSLQVIFIILASDQPVTLFIARADHVTQLRHLQSQTLLTRGRGGYMTNTSSRSVGAGTHGMFHTEITSMMHAFGDVKSCNVETVQLVEDITHRQMVDLIKEATQVTSTRVGTNITITDVLFLLRKDKQKLKQAVNYLHKRQKVHRLASQSRSEDDDEYEESFGVEKKLKVSLDFLSDAEQTDILNGEEIDIEEQQKLDAQTRSMDLTQYTEFTQSRRASFILNKNTSKFMEWLDIQTLLGSYKPSSGVIELFAYLAYKTVQKIVELSLTVKQERQQQMQDPTNSTVFPVGTDPVPYGTTPTFVTTPTGGATPPGSPKSPLLSSGPMVSPTQIISKPRPKKRGRPPKSSVSEPPPVTPPTVPPTAIQPAEVHEAMRRYTSSNVGPHLPMASHFIKTSFIYRTLCL